MATAKDITAEQALVVGLFNNPDMLTIISETVAADDFYEPKHSIIYDEMVNLQNQGKAFDPISLAASLKAKGLLKNIGGVPYIKELLSPSNITQYTTDPQGYAEIVKENSRLRNVKKAAERILEASNAEEGITSEQALSVAELELFRIINKETVGTEIYKVSELYYDVISEAELAKDRPKDTIPGIPTGFPDLDKMTSGFHGGQFIIIAARPGIGKSTLAVDFGRAAAFLAGKTVLFFSLEMSKEELAQRIVAAEARVELQKIRTGELQPTEWMEIKSIKEKVSKGTFLIDSSPRVTLSRVRSIATRQKQKPEGLDMIIIDYLQLMELSSARKNDTRQNEVSELSRNLKLLAKELQVPIIALSQLNRNSEARVDRIPQVSDLRESGSLEQDADMVLLIHRPEVNDENNRPGEADLIVGKQRSGPTGRLPLVSMLAFSKFVPGAGIYSREPEMLAEDGYSATDDETPW